jgi:hypothetical protein
LFAALKSGYVASTISFFLMTTIAFMAYFGANVLAHQ